MFAVLGPLSVLGALAGGLLGPAGIAGYALVLRLPAWVVYVVCRLRGTYTPARPRSRAWTVSTQRTVTMSETHCCHLSPRDGHGHGNQVANSIAQ